MDNLKKQIDFNLSNIGNPNETSREQTFEFWHKLRISNLLTVENTGYLLDRGLDLMLFNIKEQDTEAVLTRSYTLLMVDCLLQSEIIERLDKQQVLNLVNKICEYMQLESDWRGFSSEYGCIHAMAHLSDCVYSLAKCDYLDLETKQTLLNDYLRLLDSAKCDYMYQEDERVAKALAGFDQVLSHIIITWFNTRLQLIADFDRELRSKHVFKYRLFLKSLLVYDFSNENVKLLLKQLY